MENGRVVGRCGAVCVHKAFWVTLTESGHKYPEKYYYRNSLLWMSKNE